ARHESGDGSTATVAARASGPIPDTAQGRPPATPPTAPPPPPRPGGSGGPGGRGRVPLVVTVVAAVLAVVGGIGYLGVSGGSPSQLLTGTPTAQPAAPAPAPQAP